MIFSWNWNKNKKVEPKSKKFKSSLKKRIEIPSFKQTTPKTQREQLPETIKKPIHKSTQKELVDYKKEFIKTFKKLTYTHRALIVWQDFIIMYACALSNTVDETHYDEREKRYLKIINKYNKEEQNIFPELAAQIIIALEKNPEQDFLGDIFMSLDLGNKSGGQYFTPYHVGGLMSKVTIGNDIKSIIEEKGYIGISDPCCGSGVMLIACVNEMKHQLYNLHLNFQNYILAAAQDIDETAALMCYIQLTLLGIAGYVKIGNALTDPIKEGDTTENYWYTMMYFSNIWKSRKDK